VAVLYLAYDGSRLLVGGSLGDAREDAAELLDIERWAHLSPEHWLNRLFTSSSPLAVPADYMYATLHYLVTPAVLIWLWRRHHAHYRRARTWLAVATVLGLVGFTLFPTAPPRLLDASYGFTDVMSLHASIGWWGADAGAPRGLGSMTNQFAAMPSLHVGWALWCGAQLVRHARLGPLRVAGALYPVVIALVVMGTGNHYLLDCLAGAALMTVCGHLAGPLLRGWDRLTARALRRARPDLPDLPDRPDRRGPRGPRGPVGPVGPQGDHGKSERLGDHGPDRAAGRVTRLARPGQTITKTVIPSQRAAERPVGDSVPQG